MRNVAGAISIGIGLLLICAPFFSVLSQSWYDEDNCFGYIVSMGWCEDVEREEQFISENMINDALRNGIRVYWSSSQIQARVQPVRGSRISTVSFDPGAFVIPFSGDAHQDLMSTRIVYDYNLSHKVEVYKVLEPLDISAYKLNEPKIAYHLGGAVDSCAIYYLGTIEWGGFLNNEFLTDAEASQLNNDDFNMYVYPGADNIAGIKGMIKTLLAFDEYRAIRKFVDQGGGYIGSCYGAFMQSAGIILPEFILQALFPALPSFGLLALSDSAVFLAFPEIGTVNVRIVNPDNPVVYGVGEFTETVIYGGPVFVWCGENTKPLATFYNLTDDMKDSPYIPFTVPSSAKKVWTDYTLGKPAWTTSQFGEGKVVAFASHPEICAPTYIREKWKYPEQWRITHNAVFYATSEGPFDFQLEHNYPVCKVDDMGEVAIPLSNGVELSALREDTQNTKQLLLELHEANKDLMIKDPNDYNFAVYWFTNFLLVYLDRALSTLVRLEEVLEEGDNLGGLIVELTERNENARAIIQKTGEILSDSQEASQIIKLGIKYIPQIYFELLKKSRDVCYAHEVEKIMGGIGEEASVGPHKLLHGSLVECAGYYNQYDKAAFVYEGAGRDVMTFKVENDSGIVYERQGKPEFYSGDKFGFALDLSTLDPGKYSASIAYEGTSATIPFYVNWLDISVVIDGQTLTGIVERTWDGTRVEGAEVTVKTEKSTAVTFTDEDGTFRVEGIDQPVECKAEYRDELHYYIELEGPWHTYYCTAYEPLNDGIGALIP